MTLQVGARPLTGTGAHRPTVLAESTPYPWPYDGAFAASRTALLVLNTSSPEPGDLSAVTGVIDLMAATDCLVVSVNSSRPPRLGRRESELGAEERPPGAVRHVSEHHVSDRHVSGHDVSGHHIEAPGWDAFYGTALDSVLRSAGRDLILLSGAWLEVGVHSTMRSANDRGYECLLLSDACLSGSELTNAAALSSIEMSGGIFGAVATTAQLRDLLDLTKSRSATDPSESS